MNVNIFDLECNNLYPLQTETWTLRVKKLGQDKWLRINPFKDKVDVKKEFINFIFDEPNPIITGHNILGYDSWVLWKDFNIDFRVGPDLLCGRPVTYFDTLFASQFFFPDREGGHSLHSWGIRFGNEKIDYKKLLIEKGLLSKSASDGEEFSFWTEYMDDYCEQDCRVTEGVFNSLYQQMLDEDVVSAFKLGQKDFYLMNAQSFTGFKFDIEYGRELEIKILSMMDEIKKDVEPSLPKRKLKKSEEPFYTMPAKPFKQDGSLSANMERFINNHNAELIDTHTIKAYDKVYKIESSIILDFTKLMSLDDQKDLKEYFLENGWKPTLWNYKKDSRGKFMRDEKKKLIKTTPKIQENGKICENLLKLQGDLPNKIVRYLSLKNRLGTLRGWLSDPRLKFDGRISAGASGIANTHRQKHTKVVNVPKAQEDVLLGKEFRSLWIAEEGFKIVACDQAALEARCEAHWVHKYDPEAALELIEGDPHCFSEDTQILTENGWRLFSEITLDSKVAQWYENKIEFVNPTQVIYEEYKGDMISIKSKKLDILVTPNHRIIYCDSRREEQFSISLAKNLTNKNSSFRIPSAGNTQSEGIKELRDEEIKLLVAIQADGTYEPNCSAIRFCFVKQRKRDRLIKILSLIGCKYKESSYERKGRSELKIRLLASEFNVKMKSFLGDKKSFTEKFIHMNLHQSKIFIEELGFWDGTFTKNGDVVIDTTCEKSRDIIQIVCHLTNKSCIISEYERSGNYGKCKIYRAYISNNTKPWYSTLKSSITYQKYDGKIGCVTVPSGAILVKRNGCVVVSGNSKNALAFYPEETKSYNIKAQDFDKDDKGFKPYRSRSKNGKYSITYGASPKKVASTLGLPEQRGQELFDAFWSVNRGLKEFKDKLTYFWKVEGLMRWVPGIDKRRLYSRSEHSLVNLIFQSTAAVIMQYALALFDMKMGGLKIDHLGRPYYLYKGYIVRRIGFFHDELESEAQIPITEEIAEIEEWCMKEAGVRLKLNVPLRGESKIGSNWKEVH